MLYNNIDDYIKNLKDRVNKEMARRSAPYGSISSLGNESFTKDINDNDPIDAEHSNKTTNRLVQVSDYGNNIRYGDNQTGSNVDMLEASGDMLSKMEAEDIFSGNSCRGLCSGMCTGTCFNQCHGCTETCTGGCVSCSGGCGSGCTTGCTSCTGGCGSGCTGGCGAACKNSCGGNCTGGCTGGCTGCNNTCTGSCWSACGGGCSGNCNTSCGGACTSCGDSCSNSCSGTCKGTSRCGDCNDSCCKSACGHNSTCHDGLGPCGCKQGEIYKYSMSSMIYNLCGMRVSNSNFICKMR